MENYKNRRNKDSVLNGMLRRSIHLIIKETDYGECIRSSIATDNIVLTPEEYSKIHEKLEEIFKILNFGNT